MEATEYEKWIAELRLQVHQLQIRNTALVKDNFARQEERVQLLHRIEELEGKLKTTGDQS